MQCESQRNAIAAAIVIIPLIVSTVVFCSWNLSSITMVSLLLLLSVAGVPCCKRSPAAVGALLFSNNKWLKTRPPVLCFKGERLTFLNQLMFHSPSINNERGIICGCYESLESSTSESNDFVKSFFEGFDTQSYKLPNYQSKDTDVELIVTGIAARMWRKDHSGVNKKRCIKLLSLHLLISVYPED